MKMMTFNTRHCQNILTGEIDYPLMAQTVLACGADIVGLNEMRGRGVRRGYADQTKILSELTALPYRCFADALGRAGAPYGNALLPIRERMRDAADAFSQPLYSWPSEHPTKKIDYLFVSPDLKTVSADIPAIIASDHRTHTAVLAE